MDLSILTEVKDKVEKRIPSIISKYSVTLTKDKLEYKLNGKVILDMTIDNRGYALLNIIDYERGLYLNLPDLTEDFCVRFLEQESKGPIWRFFNYFRV